MHSRKTCGRLRMQRNKYGPLQLLGLIPSGTRREVSSYNFLKVVGQLLWVMGPLASRFNATRTAACLRECADIRNVHQEPVVKQQKIVAIFVVSTLHSMSFDLVRFFKVS